MSKPHFRAGVVTVVGRGDGCLLAFERVDRPGQWQLPQGGLGRGEEHLDAAWRELREETGLTPDEVRLVREHEVLTVYELPVALQRSGRLGQVHRWYFFEVRHDEVEPRVDGREFANWRWMTVHDLVEQVVDFRRPSYRMVLGG